MKEGDQLVRIYSGTEVLVLFLKKELEENGIAALIRNDFQSGIAAGFVGGAPSAIDLYIQESDLKKAEPILKELLQNNQD